MTITKNFEGVSVENQSYSADDYQLLMMRPKIKNNLRNIALLMLLAFGMFFLFLFASLTLDPIQNGDGLAMSKVPALVIVKGNVTRIIKLRFSEKKNPRAKKRKMKVPGRDEGSNQLKNPEMRMWRKPGKMMDPADRVKMVLKQAMPEYDTSSFDEETSKSPMDLYDLEKLRQVMSKLKDERSRKLVERMEKLSARLEKLKSGRDKILTKDLRLEAGEEVEDYFKRLEKMIEGAEKKRGDDSKDDDPDNDNDDDDDDDDEDDDDDDNDDDEDEDDDDDDETEEEAGKSEVSTIPSTTKIDRGKEAQDLTKNYLEETIVDKNDIYKNFIERYEMANKQKPKKSVMNPDKKKRSSKRKN